MTSATASCSGCFRYAMREEMLNATAWRMNCSPRPVPLTAHVALLAYVPAPTIGESPTRPYFLFVRPPVEVPAARLPCVSSATQPTVPKCCSSDEERAC